MIRPYEDPMPLRAHYERAGGVDFGGANHYNGGVFMVTSHNRRSGESTMAEFLCAWRVWCAPGRRTIWRQ